MEVVEGEGDGLEAMSLFFQHNLIAKNSCDHWNDRFPHVWRVEDRVKYLLRKARGYWSNVFCCQLFCCCKAANLQYDFSNDSKTFNTLLLSAWFLRTVHYYCPTKETTYISPFNVLLCWNNFGLQNVMLSEGFGRMRGVSYDCMDCVTHCDMARHDNNHTFRVPDSYPL